MIYRCGSRNMILDRLQSRTIDSRYVKLQEIDNYSYSNNQNMNNLYFDFSQDYNNQLIETNVTSRGVPRTLEIEIRGDLVNYNCITGDIIQIIGIVKSVQVYIIH